MAKLRGFLAAFVALIASVAGAVEWRNLDEFHRLGGRKASEGYLQGKVVLVARWGFNMPDGNALLLRLEEVWRSFKTKQFVLVGSHLEGGGEDASVRRFLRAKGISFPVYREAGLYANEPVSDKLPLIYVVDETGRVVYAGRDDRHAVQSVVTALTDMEVPRDLGQWRRFLDYELATLPGRAYLRADEFRKAFPQEAKAEYYDKFKELLLIPEVKQLAELVAFARRAKDMRAFGAESAAKKRQFGQLLADAIAKYGALKESPNPRVAREAKNALADLQWTKATL